MTQPPPSPGGEGALSGRAPADPPPVRPEPGPEAAAPAHPEPQPQATLPGHPEPEPAPEPEPPLPIPPPEPIPQPEPPHATAPDLATGPDRATGGAPADPAGAWHARHERPGEWQHPPPEHLAHAHSPPPQSRRTTTLSPDAEATMRRRRTGLWASVALTVTLLVCGGGAASAYILFRTADTGGAPDPATAVNRFLTAVYTEQDPAAAADLVCREARDSAALAARIDEIRGYASEYDGPSFRWSDPAVGGRTEERATVSVDLTLTTDDEKTAGQRLTFTTIRKTNWLVCEITG